MGQSSCPMPLCYTVTVGCVRLLSRTAALKAQKATRRKMSLPPKRSGTPSRTPRRQRARRSRTLNRPRAPSRPMASRPRASRSTTPRHSRPRSPSRTPRHSRPPSPSRTPNRSRTPRHSRPPRHRSRANRSRRTPRHSRPPSRLSRASRSRAPRHARARRHLSRASRSRTPSGAAMRPPPIEVYIPHVDLGRERWIREIAGSGLRSDILLQNIQKREFPNFRTTHLRICWYQENQNGNVVIGQDLFPSRVVIPPGAKVVVMHRTYGVRPYGNLVYCEARPTVTKPLDEPDEDEPKPDAFDPSPPRCPPPPPSPPRRPPQPRCPRLPPPLSTTKDQAREEVRHQSPWRSLQEVRTSGLRVSGP